MHAERGYQSYEEFEREELRRLNRPDVTVEELMDEFVLDDFGIERKKAKEGLFDGYESDEDEDEEEGD